LAWANPRLSRRPEPKDLRGQERMFYLHLLRGEYRTAAEIAAATAAVVETESMSYPWLDTMVQQMTHIAGTAMRDPAEALQVCRAQAVTNRQKLRLIPA
jgi:hypothetical protein